MSSSLNAADSNNTCTIFEEGPNYVEILPHGDIVQFSLNSNSTITGLTVNIQGWDKVKRVVIHSYKGIPNLKTDYTVRPSSKGIEVVFTTQGVGLIQKDSSFTIE
eukprot:gene11625-4867_t